MTTFQRSRGGEPPLPVEEAQRRVLAAIGPLGSETVTLTNALGRVLREDVDAPCDVPEAANSAMDGYAVRSEDVAAIPCSLQVIEDLPAGAIARRQVERGTAVRIMTGALLPAGADTVVHVEITDAGSELVTVLRPVVKGTNVRRRGEDMRAGERILPAGIVIGPAEIGVLAGAQRGVVQVGRRPTIAVLSTGNELIEIDSTRKPGQVVNSNAYSLAALALQAGAIPTVRGIVPDSLSATIAAIEDALDADFVVSSGGVSAGAYDYVKEALDKLGAETKFWQIAMKPGKPVVFAQLRDRMIFGLPGNPVSSMVSFLLFVAPAIRRAAGQTTDVLPPVVRTRMKSGMHAKGDRRSYHRVRVIAEGGELVAYPMRAQGSGVSTSMVQANGLSIVEAGVTTVAAGSSIDTVLFAPLHGSADARWKLL